MFYVVTCVIVLDSSDPPQDLASNVTVEQKKPNFIDLENTGVLLNTLAKQVCKYSYV